MNHTESLVTMEKVLNALYTNLNVIHENEPWPLNSFLRCPIGLKLIFISVNHNIKRPYSNYWNRASKQHRMVHIEESIVNLPLPQKLRNFPDRNNNSHNCHNIWSTALCQGMTICNPDGCLWLATMMAICVLLSVRSQRSVTTPELFLGSAGFACLPQCIVHNNSINRHRYMLGRLDLSEAFGTWIVSVK